ncbi:uncharacterized protein LOC124336261 [Daphnia pulicaria]|uniref:uncharacterized protein LOC124336261 n=1 Tax=Daphnia pulicaria TaxID=35523 RepID=UPI001EEC328B|nr:uncharacterized protein LOC124336261 [Daphnia pulicaria]
MDPTSIQPKENVDWKQQNASCVTVDEFHVMMKEAEVKEKQDKKEIYELIGALDDKPMDVGNKVNKRIDTLQERSNKRMDILEENNINYLTSKISKIIDRLAVPINDEMPVLAGFEQIIRAFSFSSDMKSCSLVGGSSSKNSNNLKPYPSMATLMDLNTLHHVSPKETLHNDSHPIKEENLMTDYYDCYCNPPFHTCQTAPSIIGDNAKSYSSEIRRKEGEVAMQAPYVNLDTGNSPLKHSLKSRYRSDRRSSPMMNVKNVPNSDIECKLKQYEYADSEFQTSKTSLSAVEIEATRLISTNDECGIPQYLTSRKCELQFNGNTQTLSCERDLLSENKPLNSSTSSLPPFIEGDQEVTTPCVSLECTTAPSSDSIVAPFVSRCSSIVEIPLRISTRQKSRPHRYRDTDDDWNI